MDSSVNDMCYKQIIDQYWYCLYGDFIIVVDKNTGTFNATKLCRDVGRKLDDWLKMKQSKKLVNYICKKNNSKVFQVETGEKDEIYNEIICGTYLPIDCYLSLVTWLSPAFYDKILKIVFAEMCTKSVEPKDTEKSIKP